MNTQRSLARWLIAAGILVATLIFATATLIALGNVNQALGSSSSIEDQPRTSEIDGRETPIGWPGPRPAVDVASSSTASRFSTQLAPSEADYANCRLGVGVVRNPIDVYTDATNLRIGWYYDWVTRLNPSTPNGIEYAQTIRISQPRIDGQYLPTHTIRPPLTDIGLGARVDVNPGAMWFVGNEPDVWSQDGVTADQYALAYHKVYHFIKQRDPSARVAIGAVVQPTPLRLQYLDTILGYYYQTHGTSMPVDIWNIHVYIIQEVKDSWGVQIPPGMDATVGTVFPIEAHGNVTVFSQLVEDFRDWMARRGQRNKPLIISEMGVLIPEWWQPQFNEARVIQYMQGSFDFLLSKTDPDIGFPADNNRLVQQWNWFSLDDDSVDGDGYSRWNGWLFNSTTRQPTAEGEAFASYAAQLSPTVDLVAYQLTQHPPVVFSPDRPATITLEAHITNAGNVPLTDTVNVRFYEVLGTSEVQIGNDTVITDLKGCGVQVARVSVVWPNVAPGAHEVRVRVDPQGRLSEPNRTNNTLDSFALIGTDRIFLPLAIRSF